MTSKPPARHPGRRAFSLLFIVIGLVVIAWAVTMTAVDGDRERPERVAPIERGDRPVVLITVDTTRPDRLGPYGSESVETPVLDHLAREGVTFEHAYSVAPITLVAHASILSGTDPTRHGVRNNGIHYAPDRVVSIAETLSDAGYATGAFVSAAVLDRRYNLDQGFDVYDDDLSTGRHRHPRMVADRPAEAVVSSAIDWLDSVPEDRPYFLWVHLYDPHAPYSPPPPWRDRYRGRLYDGEVAYMDHHIGRLVEHDRVREQAVVSVLGDHGESLGEHGEQTHALLAYDSTLHVPWILRIPGGPRGKRIPQTVGQVDLVPTLLELLGKPSPSVTDGMSLLPLLESEVRQDARLGRQLYAETFLPFYTYGWARLRVLRDGPLKWIDAPEPELYDTSRDPRELSNLAGQMPDAAHDLSRDLGAHRAEAPDRSERENELALDQKALEQLQGLGYIASSGVSDSNIDDADRPDPKDMIDLHVGLERARSLMASRLYEEAQQQLERVLSRDPNNIAASMDLADALAARGETAAAIEELEHALSLDPGNLSLQLRLSVLEAGRGELDRAMALLDGILEQDPNMSEAYVQKAILLARSGRRQPAAGLLEEALDRNPDSARLNTAYARLIEQPVDADAAEKRLRKALERDPFHVPAWVALGGILDAAGKPDAAVAAWESGLKRDPDNAELHARLGSLLARAGADASAESHLREALRLTAEPRPDIHVTLGAWLAEHGRLDQALAEYDRALAIAPRHAGARNNRAVALYLRGESEKAEQAWQALVEQHPRHADAWNNLTALAIERGDFDRALELAERVVTLDPDMAQAWNNLGLARDGLGDRAEAQAAFRRALERAPDYWRARLNLGRSLRGSGAARAAGEVLSKLVDRMPNLAEAHYELGWIYADDLDDPGRARKHFNAFLRMAAADPRADSVRDRIEALPAR